MARYRCVLNGGTVSVGQKGPTVLNGGTVRPLKSLACPHFRTVAPLIWDRVFFRRAACSRAYARDEDSDPPPNPDPD
jgi:hypothetical protein